MNLKKILCGLLLSSCLTGCVGLMVQYPITTRTQERGVSAVDKARTNILAQDKCVRLDASTSEREIYRCDEGVRPMLVFIGAGIPLPLPYAGRHNMSTYEITADTVVKRSKAVGSTGAICAIVPEYPAFCALGYRDKEIMLEETPAR